MLDEIITRILEDNHTGRLGKVFKTKNNRYFYDMGTGKIAQINEKTNQDSQSKRAKDRTQRFRVINKMLIYNVIIIRT